MTARGYREPLALPRRFYKAVGVEAVDGGHAVRLDGRTPRTPAGRPLVLPTDMLARLAAEEWAAQGEHILMATMPTTRLAHTAIDGVADKHVETAGELARYAGSDLLCYFAEEPMSLVERQGREWAPILDWARADLGLDLQPTEGIVHRPQSPEALERARELAMVLDDFSLAALAHAAGLFGSAVLALGLQRGRLSGREAFDLSRLDEIFQEEQWGVDAEAAERTERMAGEALMLERWFAALR